MTANDNNHLPTFQVGKDYFTRSACDHECIFTIHVIRRTAKSIIISDRKGLRSLRIFRDSYGCEAVKPYGSYSMAPIISADRVDA